MTAHGESVSEPKLTMPTWAVEPFTQFNDQHHEADHLLHISVRGIEMVTNAPKVTELLAEIDGTTEAEETRRRLHSARSAAALAKSEVDKGFPVLHSQALVSMWGSLEALVKSIVAARLTNEPQHFEAKELSGLKVPLALYRALDPLEQCEYVVRIVDQPGGLQGVSRFERLLAMVGLGGSVDAGVRRDLFELEQLRHVLVHRRGLADRKLLEACPGLGMSLGDRIQIDHRRYRRMWLASHAYAYELLRRTAEQLGVTGLAPNDSACSNAW